MDGHLRVAGWSAPARGRACVVLLTIALLSVSACGDDDSDVAGILESSENISAEEVAQWPEKWCSVQPGATRDDLVEVMGQPTSETEESLSWSAFNYQFNAFLDVQGHIRQMDINTIMLSQAEQSALECDETRVLD
jgi:hypothetical protein